MKRNLIYHICPFKSNWEWKRNVEEILKYIHHFNGKKIVTIVHGDGLAPFNKVKRNFGNHDIKFIRVKNNPALGEVVPFEKMTKEVFSTNSNEITFYAHAKGVSPQHQRNPRSVTSIRAWRNISYYFCLNNINYIDSILSDFDSCGCFYTPPTKIVRAWHFAGTFFWFRHDKIFTRKDWCDLTQNRFGVETYLGERLDPKNSYNLFGEQFPHDILYIGRPSTWQVRLNPYGLKVENFIK